ncbi:hypothetical protein ACKWTF_008883 [Chironomus riparius]
MTSSEVKRSLLRAAPVDPNDEIVISGISGRFPSSANVAEFAHNLYNKIDMVNDAETRWKHIDPEIPTRLGKTVNLNKFDASFFSVHNRQASYMDPQCRCLLEHAYEAVLDAGISPKAIKGSRTGVYVGCCFAESEEFMFYEKSVKDGLGLTGSARAMLANRISFGMDLQGPSFMVDTACSSATYGLDAAFNAIRSGECDAALVGGTNLLLHPHITLQFARLGVLSKDGFCRPLDKDAAGYTRSEAISLIFLQRKRDAKRVYANLVYTKTNNDGFKKEGITYPSGFTQIQLLEEFYKDIKLDPRTVDYVEGHSTGTKVGDPEECHTLDTIFCKGREGPLLIGAVKSNMGHSEATSGICSIAKLILMFERQEIPATIHYKGPRSDCKALIEGRLKVIDENTEFKGKLVSMNSFGFGGGNAHALFKAVTGDKINHGIPNDDLPRLVTWSGRTEEAVETVMNAIIERPLDAEFVGLLHNTQIETVSSNIYRGFGIFAKNGEENATCINKSVQNFSASKRPIVWVYSGMGSQWAGMGADLMKIPIFAKAIETCHNALLDKGINLIEIVTSEDPTTFDNILNAFVGISAIQMGLTDILKALGIVPDYIIGHSFGELGCAYADNCCSPEEMILSAYSRGMASLETKVPFGSMAAVGMGYNQLKDITPEGIEIACHNSADSCTISGPADEIAKFVAKLKSDNFFAKEVACANIPYHSKYIADMGPNLLKRLREVIKNPVKRSEKWICSSVPESNWKSIESEYSSAEYHTNNLLSPVLFEEATTHLPKDAMTIEIAPYGLLQSILKRSLGEGQHFSLTQRNNKENAMYLLNSLGKLFENGLDFDVSKLYPPVQFPVSRGTPMIAPLIKWDHKQDLFVYKFDERIASEKSFTVNLLDQDYEFISGHEIDGRVLFPATGYLYLTWEAMAYQHRFPIHEFDIEFEDVKFLRATTVSKTQEVELVVVIQKGTGRFEILDGTTAVCTGLVRRPVNSKLTVINTPEDSKLTTLYNRDFYKELRLRGYNYKNLFRSVHTARSDGLKGRVKWQDNWVAFLDCLLQLQIIASDTRSLILPTGLRKLVIHPKEHLDMLNAIERNEKIMDVHCSDHIKALRCGGIEMRGLNANSVGRRQPPGFPVLETYQFTPHFPAPVMDKTDMARFCVQLALENFPSAKFVCTEIDTNNGLEPIINAFGEAVGDLPLITSDLTYLTAKTELELPTVKLSESDISSCANNNFIIRSDCLADQQFLELASSQFADNGFIVSRESNEKQQAPTLNIPNGYQVVAVVPMESEIIVLLHYTKAPREKATKVIKIDTHDDTYPWIEELQQAVAAGPVIAYAENDKLSGIIGLVNCIRKEPNGNNLRCVYVDDTTAPPFNLEDPFYATVLNQGLAINVYRNGQWGSYKHLILRQNLEPARYTSHCYANSLIRSDLSSIKWFEGPMGNANGDDIVRIMYSSLNFRDVMLATGKLAIETCAKTRLEQQCVTGFEFSGVKGYGNYKRVMGMVIGGALGTHVQMDADLLWNVPDDWPLSEAASYPVVYGTVYSCFFITTQIKKGKSILIHAGSGGVGLAAIRVALAYGLNVFTTVSTEEKKDFLLNEFPQLKREHIGHSRDTSFEDLLMTLTEGKGVDYVLNSLAEEKLQSSIRCLGQGGIFLEIGKFDMSKDSKIGLGEFLRELSFHAVLVDNLLRAPHDEKMVLKRLMQNDLDRGIIKPLKTTIYKAHEIEQAYRFLASGKHMGKVIVQIRENETDEMTLPITVLPRLYCNPEHSYIIPGGLGGFGLELADWLVLRGCKKLVLSSSRGISKQYQAYRISIFESYGTKVVVNTSDISTKSGCEDLILEAMKMGPIGGIFNLAVLLKDSIFENQDATKFAESMAPKAIATKYLDEISRVLCPVLKYFVVFSSVSCGRGNAGQSNYGMSNSVMERIMEQRKNDGLPAKAIQWGAVGEVGLVADMAEDKLDMEIGGTLQQRISSCLQELDGLILNEHPIVASMVVAEKRYSSESTGNIIDTIMNVMSIKDPKSVSMETTLSELGMDSLMTVEIQQTLEREYDVVISPQELRSMTLSQLQKCVNNRDSTDTDKKTVISNDKVPKGIALMLRNCGDETNSKETILKLQSQSDEGVKALILPGIEGMAGNAWYEISKNMRYPTYILQILEKAWQSRELDEICKNVESDVVELYRDDTEFFFVGYSFGALMAMKLAKVLEQHGKVGRIVLIDGAPKLLKTLAVDQLPDNWTDDMVRNIILTMIIISCIPEDNGTIIKEILAIPSFDARIKKLATRQTMYSEEYGLKICSAFVNRLILTAKVDLNTFEKVDAKFSLIRPSEPSITEIEEDYDLGQYTNKHVAVKYLEGNHATLLDNPNLPAELNNM